MNPFVIHVTTTDWTLCNLLDDQLQHIQSAGYTVGGVISPTDKRQQIEEMGIRLYEVPFERRISPLKDLRSVFQLYRLFREIRPNIVHTHNPKTGLIGQLAARLAGVPIIINTVHGFYFTPDSSRLRQFFFANMERIAALCSTHILSQNSEDIETALRLKICRPDTISYLGNGINLADFDPSCFDAASRRVKKLELGVAADAPVIGIIGRLVAEKGYPEFAAAAKQVKQRYPNAVFLAIGPVEHEKRDVFRDEDFATYGLEVGKDVLSLGTRDDIPALLSIMDVFAFPSHREGFPRSLMEAATMGVGLVATDIRGNREVVKHGETGLLVPLRDVDALAKGILTLLDSPDYRAQLTAHAVEFAKEHFDQRLVFQRVVNTYDRLLNQP